MTDIIFDEKMSLNIKNIDGKKIVPEMQLRFRVATAFFLEIRDHDNSDNSLECAWERFVEDKVFHKVADKNCVLER